MCTAYQRNEEEARTSVRVLWVPLSPAFPQRKIESNRRRRPEFLINRLVFYKERFSMPPPHPHQPTHPPTHPWIHSSPMDSLAPKDKDKEDPRADGLMHPIGPYVYCLLKERRRGKDKCEGIVGPLVARLSPTQD